MYKFTLLTALLFLVSCGNKESLSKNNSDTNNETVEAVDDLEIIENQNDDSENYYPEDTFYTETIMLGDRYEVNEYTVYEKLPKLRMSDISQSEYEKYVSEYKNIIVNDSTKINIDSKRQSFSFYTSKGAKSYPIFEYGEDDKFEIPKDTSWVKYRGYIPELNLYLLDHIWASEIIAGELLLIDSLSNIKYEVVSISDGSMDLPVVSPNQSFLTLYCSDGTLENTSIYIIKRDKTDSGYYIYKDYAGIELNNLVPIEVVWMNNSSLAVKLESFWSRNTFYFKKLSLP